MHQDLYSLKLSYHTKLRLKTEQRTIEIPNKVLSMRKPFSPSDDTGKSEVTGLNVGLFVVSTFIDGFLVGI